MQHAAARPACSGACGGRCRCPSTQHAASSTSPSTATAGPTSRSGAGPALLLLHGLGCDHTTWEPVIDPLAAALHRDRARPARARPVRQAARRLQRRRLRQRHARPAHRAGHRQGDRGRPQLRRRRGDAVRLPVPRAHRAAGAGRAPAASAPRSPPRSGRSPRPASTRSMGVLTLPGRAPRSHGRAALLSRSRARATPATSTRSPRSTTRSRTRPRPGGDPRTSCAPVVDWRGQIVTMADRAYLTEAMPMCVIWGDRRPGDPRPPRRATRARSRPRRRGRGDPATPATSRTRTTPSGSSRSLADFMRTTEPASTTASAGASCSTYGRGPRPRPRARGESPLRAVHAVPRARRGLTRALSPSSRRREAERVTGRVQQHPPGLARLRVGQRGAEVDDQRARPRPRGRRPRGRGGTACCRARSASPAAGSPRPVPKPSAGPAPLPSMA